jgi:acetate kinase
MTFSKGVGSSSRLRHDTPALVLRLARFSGFVTGLFTAVRCFVSRWVIVDDEAILQIKDLIPLAPLHNPSNVAAIEVLRALRPDVPNVAVFDTAFHQAMPQRAFHYALPLNLITLHLGNGASGAAVQGGRALTLP